MSEEISKYELQRASGEKALQESIVQNLQMAGWSIAEFGKPGGHKAQTGSVPPGWPDLLAIKHGRHAWMEVKLPGEKPTRVQRDCHSWLRMAGAYVCVVSSVESALKEIEHVN